MLLVMQTLDVSIPQKGEPEPEPKRLKLLGLWIEPEPKRLPTFMWRHHSPQTDILSNMNSMQLHMSKRMPSLINHNLFRKNRGIKTEFSAYLKGLTICINNYDNFCFFTFYVIISLWRLLNQCSKRIIMALREPIGIKDIFIKHSCFCRKPAFQNTKRHLMT